MAAASLERDGGAGRSAAERVGCAEKGAKLEVKKMCSSQVDELDESKLSHASPHFPERGNEWNPLKSETDVKRSAGESRGFRATRGVESKSCAVFVSFKSDYLAHV